jgi:tetratricopeptide (TPR) repeat protein
MEEVMVVDDTWAQEQVDWNQQDMNYHEEAIHIDPVIAAMRQEEEQLATTQSEVQDEKEDNLIWETTSEADTSESGVVGVEEHIQITEIDSDGDGEVDVVAAVHTITPPLDVAEAKRQKSIEMFQFELRSLKEKGHTSAYEKKLIEARALHPERSDFTTMLAEHYYDQAEYKKSLWLYRKLVDADPTEDKSLAMIANCYIKLGEWENAQVILEKLIQEKPENPRYRMSLAEVYYNFKQLDKTVDCVRTMVKLRPTNMDYLSTLAQLYHEAEQYDLYVQILYRMLELDPLNHDIKAEIEKYS